MGVSLDLRKAHKHQRVSDFVVVLTWMNDERALVLLPALRRDAGWYVVMESAAHLWGVDHPDRELRKDAMDHAVKQSEVACDMLGLEPSRMNKARVISTITSWLPDLIEMPSSPEESFLKGAFGELQVRADGKAIGGEDIRVADAGVTYG